MSDEGENESCKVVLLGETGVGKTSIITQFMEQIHETNLPSTTGAIYSATSLNIDGVEAKFEIWDTAGQEKYRALTKMFYKDACAAILVYDITKPKTFEEIKNYWAKELNDNAPKNLIKVITGNKSDLYEDEQVDESSSREFAAQIGALYKRTSAKNAEGIESLFMDIGKVYLNHGVNKAPPEAKRKETVKINKKSEQAKQDENSQEKKKKCC